MRHVLGYLSALGCAVLAIVMATWALAWGDAYSWTVFAVFMVLMGLVMYGTEPRPVLPPAEKPGEKADHADDRRDVA